MEYKQLETELCPYDGTVMKVYFFIGKSTKDKNPGIPIVENPHDAIAICAECPECGAFYEKIIKFKEFEEAT